MRGGAARRENLRAFFSLAEEFERGGGRGLFAFVRHLREQLESGEPPVPQTTHAAQGVRIMSIHKSKGTGISDRDPADLARRRSAAWTSRAPCSSTRNTASGRSAWTRNARSNTPRLRGSHLSASLRREAKAEELRVLYTSP